MPVLLDVATKVSICKAGITAKNVGSHLVFSVQKRALLIKMLLISKKMNLEYRNRTQFIEQTETIRLSILQVIFEMH